LISDHCVVGASSGDSAAIALSAGEPARELTQGQHKNPPVGSGAATFASFSARLKVPWIILAMSDGVWKYAGWEPIIQAAGRFRGAALVKSLQDLARLPHGGRFPDDFTLVVFDDGGSCSVTTKRELNHVLARTPTTA
jgi:hypothetical protein